MLAIYTRVSTALQVERGTSMETQLEQCIVKAKEQGFNSWQLYADEGYSGMDLDRPGITQLREDIAKGQITTLICWDVDRLARGTIYQLLMLEEIRKYKTDLVFVNTHWQDTPEGRLLFQMQSIIAEYELAKIKLRTTWGRIRCAKNGRVMPMRMAPFGYDYNSAKGILTVNGQEAPYVPMIYRWYIFDHLTLRQIAQKLMDLGVTAKGGGNWSASSLRRILQSPVYIGKFYYNKRETRVKADGGRTPAGYKRREYTVREPQEWIEIKVPAIITNQLYELAQKQAGKNNTTYKSNNKFNYLFKGLLKCGHCGRLWQATTTKSYPIYRCPGRNPKTYGPDVEKCPSRSINGRKLEEFLWRQVTQVMANSTVLEKLLSVNHIDDPSLKNMLVLTVKTLEQAEIEKQKVLRLYQLDKFTEEEAGSEIDKIKAKVEKIKSQQDELRVRIAGLAKGFNHDNLKATGKELGALLNQGLAFEEKRRLVEMLIDEIEVLFNEATVTLMIKGPLGQLKHCLQHQEV